MFEFTEHEKEAIKQAVKEVEKETSGEIVTYFTEQSDSYSYTCWKSAGLFMIMGCLSLITLSLLWLLPGWITPFDYALIIIVMGIIGFFIPYFLGFTRILLASGRYIDERVAMKAKYVFYEEGVYKTADKTGVLIFISYKEKRVVVLGDVGINSKVNSHEWQEVVDFIVLGIKEDRTTEGIVNAIHMCKDLLLKNGFITKPNDTNELSNEIRIDN